MLTFGLLQEGNRSQKSPFINLFILILPRLAAIGGYETGKKTLWPDHFQVGLVIGLMRLIRASRGRRCLKLTLALALMYGPAQARDGFFAPFLNMFDGVPDFHLPRPDIKLPKIEIAPFWTNDLKQGREAFARGDYASARVSFTKASDEGNVVADWYLGHMYRVGKGVPMDPAIAFSYFTRVAETFNAEEPDAYRLRITVDAKIRVADYLRLGIPAARLAANAQDAARIYMQMATNFGHPRAFYELGQMSLEGEGMKKNPQQGLKWLYAATRKGSAEAAALLGDLTDRGEYVTQDDAKALSWYMIAIV